MVIGDVRTLVCVALAIDPRTTHREIILDLRRLWPVSRHDLRELRSAITSVRVELGLPPRVYGRSRGASRGLSDVEAMAIVRAAIARAPHASTKRIGAIVRETSRIDQARLVAIVREVRAALGCARKPRGRGANPVAASGGDDRPPV